MFFKRIFSTLGAIVASAVVAGAVSIPLLTGPQDVSQMNATFNALITQINSLVTPAGVQVFPNVIDNGDMRIQQRGTADTTCAQNAGVTSAAYGADRWVCSANVAVGAGHQQVITTSPAPPTGFQASTKVWRASGALTQPVCTIQEISSGNSIPLAGQQVTLSFYAAALAGLAADNGGVITANIITGTGTNEGLGTMTASPAITPAWTGIATPLAQNFTLTTSFVRYTTSVTLASTVKEIGVLLCFTPTATGAGATDGFAFTGVQLERGGAATNYQFMESQQAQKIAQSYYVQFADNLAATFTLPATCAETTANTVAACTMVLPTTMRATPVSVVATATSFGMTKTADGTAGACSTLAVIASSNTPNTIGLTCALSETAAVGTMHRLIYANTGAANTLTISADF